MICLLKYISILRSHALSEATLDLDLKTVCSMLPLLLPNKAAAAVGFRD